MGAKGDMPLSSRDFQRAAKQRLTTAEFLFTREVTREFLSAAKDVYDWVYEQLP
jgi:hypothetical protein